MHKPCSGSFQFSQTEKVQATHSQRKIMATVLGQKRCAFGRFHGAWNNHHIAFYCETVSKQCHAIQNQWQGILRSGIVLLHNNARPHMATHTIETLQTFWWEMFYHPPCSPDLTPKDYHLFVYFKNWLVSQRFKETEELKTLVQNWHKQAAQFYAMGLKNLLHNIKSVWNLSLIHI